MLFLGDYNKLKVVRKTDIGYVLVSEDNEEVFVHNKEVITEPKIDEFVSVFLYYDKKKRIAGTFFKAIVTTTSPGFGKVVSIDPTYGLFVNIGIFKDIMFSKDYLPQNIQLWPKENDTLCVILKNKKSSLEARPLDKNDLEKFKDNAKYNIKDEIKAYVHKINEVGITLITEDFISVWVFQKNKRANYRIGEELTVTINHLNEFGQYSGTLILPKEAMIEPDSNEIFEILKKDYQGKMPFDNNTDPEAILDKFKMSKKAFKRALGHLYKKRMIDFKDGFTILIKNE